MNPHFPSENQQVWGVPCSALTTTVICHGTIRQPLIPVCFLFIDVLKYLRSGSSILPSLIALGSPGSSSLYAKPETGLRKETAQSWSEWRNFGMPTLVKTWDTRPLATVSAVWLGMAINSFGEVIH